MTHEEAKEQLSNWGVTHEDFDSQSAFKGVIKAMQEAVSAERSRLLSQAGVPTLNDFNDWLREQAYENILPTKESAFEWMLSRMSSLLFQERQRAEKEQVEKEQWQARAYEAADALANDVQKLAEKEAMEFAEWLAKNNHLPVFQSGRFIRYGAHDNLSDLFALWKKQAGEKGAENE